MKEIDEAYRQKIFSQVREAREDMQQAEDERRNLIDRYVYPATAGEEPGAALPLLTADNIREILEAGKQCELAANAFAESLRRYKSLL